MFHHFDTHWYSRDRNFFPSASYLKLSWHANMRNGSPTLFPTSYIILGQVSFENMCCTFPGPGSDKRCTKARRHPEVKALAKELLRQGHYRSLFVNQSPRSASENCMHQLHRCGQVTSLQALTTSRTPSSCSQVNPWSFHLIDVKWYCVQLNMIM